jgi:hypothetical protein
MALPRLHLFELEDLEWFPDTIRNLALDYLGFMEVRFALHKPVMPLLRRMFAQTGTLNVVDLCSGRGELVLALYEALSSEGIDVEFTLTDKFPNLIAFRYISSQHPLKLHYVTGSVDATKVPPELAGLRTIFNAFHHFPPRAARRVLEDAVKAGQPICIFEIPERRLLTIISLLLTPLFVVFATPFIRPFRWKRLLWTYLIPLVPFMCCWDGVISQLRAYTIAELSELTHGLEDYEWSAGNTPIHGQPGHLTYLLGETRSDNVSLIPCRYKIVNSTEPEYDHHAALDSHHCGTIRWVNCDSAGACSASVGNLYAPATLWMGRGIPGILELDWLDRGHTRGRTFNLDSCFRHSPGSVKGQAGADSLFPDDAWPVPIDTQSDVRR